MIKEIIHAGVNHVNDHIADSRPNLLISILDVTSPLQRPDFKRFDSVLSLAFKDRCEEDYGLMDLWPDEPDLSTNYSVLGLVNERLFSIRDANRIVEFFETHHKQDQEYNLIIHCKSGVGRSAAIAQFFGTLYEIPFKGTDPRGRFMPNYRVMRLLSKAHQDKYPYVDKRNYTSIYELDVSRYWDINGGF